MNGIFVFLNKSSYVKEGERRCYASFAESNGAIVNFNGVAVPDDAFPEPFSVCDVTFQTQAFGQGRVAFILEKIDVRGKLVEK